jgi:hypothetical protein
MGSLSYSTSVTRGEDHAYEKPQAGVPNADAGGLRWNASVKLVRAATVIFGKAKSRLPELPRVVICKKVGAKDKTWISSTIQHCSRVTASKYDDQT